MALTDRWSVGDRPPDNPASQHNSAFQDVFEVQPLDADDHNCDGGGTSLATLIRREIEADFNAFGGGGGNYPVRYTLTRVRHKC